MEIRFIKLKCGDEIITEYSELDNLVTLTNPTKLALTQEGVKLMSYPLVCRNNIEDKIIINIPSQDILFSVLVNKDTESTYKSMFDYSSIISATSIPNFER